MDTLRLSPLAFPRNPYHQPGQTLSGWRSPARPDQRSGTRFTSCAGPVRRRTAKPYGAGRSPDLLIAWHWLCTPARGRRRAALSMRCSAKSAVSPLAPPFGTKRQARHYGRQATERRGLRNPRARRLWRRRRRPAGRLAYALAWLSVVRRQFGDAALGAPPVPGGRATGSADSGTRACADPACGWCRERHDAHARN